MTRYFMLKTYNDITDSDLELAYETVYGKRKLLDNIEDVCMDFAGVRGEIKCPTAEMMLLLGKENLAVRVYSESMNCTISEARRKIKSMDVKEMATDIIDSYIEIILRQPTPSVSEQQIGESETPNDRDESIKSNPEDNGIVITDENLECERDNAKAVSENPIEYTPAKEQSFDDMETIIESETEDALAMYEKTFTGEIRFSESSYLENSGSDGMIAEEYGYENEYQDDDADGSIYEECETSDDFNSDTYDENSERPSYEHSSDTNESDNNQIFHDAEIDGGAKTKKKRGVLKKMFSWMVFGNSSGDGYDEDMSEF